MEQKRRVRAKVWAATAGAGIGGGAAAISAPDVATLLVDLLHLTLSEGGARGLASVIAVLWSIILSAAGSLGAGYAKSD